MDQVIIAKSLDKLQTAVYQLNTILRVLYDDRHI